MTVVLDSIIALYCVGQFAVDGTQLSLFRQEHQHSHKAAALAPLSWLSSSPDLRLTSPNHSRVSRTKTNRLLADRVRT